MGCFVLQSTYVRCCQQYRMVRRSCKMPDTSEFQQIWILSTDFNESLPYKIAWKVIQWGLSCYMQMMEVTKLLAAFCNYLNVTTKINFFIASVPHASECNLHIGLALFPNLTQNGWLILCSKFQLHIFQQETLTHTSHFCHSFDATEATVLKTAAFVSQNMLQNDLDITKYTTTQKAVW